MLPVRVIVPLPAFTKSMPPPAVAEAGVVPLALSRMTPLKVELPPTRAQARRMAPPPLRSRGPFRPIQARLGPRPVCPEVSRPGARHCRCRIVACESSCTVESCGRRPAPAASTSVSAWHQPRSIAAVCGLAVQDSGSSFGSTRSAPARRLPSHHADDTRRT